MGIHIISELIIILCNPSIRSASKETYKIVDDDGSVHADLLEQVKRGNIRGSWESSSNNVAKQSYTG